VGRAGRCGLPRRAARAGSVTAACRVAGFCTRTAYNRRNRLPGFAASWDEALTESPPRLEARMLAEAMKRIDPQGWDEPGDAAPFDRGRAIRIVGRLDKRARRR
jgi:hypothetical protein